MASSVPGTRLLPLLVHSPPTPGCPSRSSLRARVPPAPGVVPSCVGPVADPEGCRMLNLTQTLTLQGSQFTSFSFPPRK